ncbi:MAG: hypothetical protein FJW56_09995 [Actinobacteria bacterium]|nr:hypothetical protein [Actinomycetota bacterium]
MDNKNNVLDNGKLGEIIATGFYNRTMPLIRYKTGDLAVKKGIDCRCGRQHDIIERLDGRVEEVIITPDNRYVSALSNAVKYASGMDYVQILQKKKSFIDVRIVKNKSFKNKNLTDLENELRLKLGYEIKINFLFVPEIKPSSNGKIRFVINLMLKR